MHSNCKTTIPILPFPVRSELAHVDEKLQKAYTRKLRNRESAAASRKRTRDQVISLQVENASLKEQNKKLESKIARYRECLDDMFHTSSFLGNTCKHCACDLHYSLNESAVLTKY
mmetsp:Transcript_7462/g.11283  ORF Transcript_7462/g.11283 Transcript_7462/m.11283 type:complete len:115 (+) Transcript_7462:85-429(+)